MILINVDTDLKVWPVKNNESLKNISMLSPHVVIFMAAHHNNYATALHVIKISQQ